MIRLRNVFAITMAVAVIGNVVAAPSYYPEAEAVERLAPAFATRDPARLAMAFRAMGEFGAPAARIVEATINATGYRHLENGDIDAAIKVFDLNTDTFPLSSNAWDSLAEAVMLQGDREAALRYFRRALELDAANTNAANMIERLSGSELFGLTSGV